jgi:flagellar biosynthetic protein FlhB
MPDNGEGTEKPTPERIKRARREGDFVSSREFVSSVHFIGFVAIVAAFCGAWLARTVNLTRTLLLRSFGGDLTPASLTHIVGDLILPHMTPLIFAGAALFVLSIGAQLAITGFGISFAKFTPDFNRLDVVKRLANLPGQNLPLLIQAMVLLPVVGFVGYYEVKENLNAILELPWMAPQAGLVRVSETLESLLWRAAGLFLIAGIADLLWQRHRYTQRLRMTKPEIRQETREQEGNPYVKRRIRQLQRDAARRSGT